MSRLVRAHLWALLVSTAFAVPTRAAELDLIGGVLSLVDTGGVANSLDIALTGAGTIYTIDDPAEAAIVPTANALGAGCVSFDTNTVTCPAAAVASFRIDTRLGNDRIVMVSAMHPALVMGGDGNDSVVGGLADDVMVWNPGDDNDVLDGNGGGDTLVFNGSNASEAITVMQDGPAFVLTRNVANVTMVAERIETLALHTLGGTDTVVTSPLLTTLQQIDDADDGLADVLTLDAQGLCPFAQADGFETVGRHPVQVAGFPTVFATNAICGAILDLAGGVLSYTGANQPVANQLDVSLAGGTYTLSDPGEGISPSPAAVAQGCEPVASDTVTCPAAALTSFSIATRLGNDTVALSNAAHPALVTPGDGDDTVTGGLAGDTFVWNPGDDDDVLDGAGGSDTVVFNGSNASEIYVITADGAGFDLTRNVANVRMAVENTEALELTTFGGTDEVSTTNLRRTTQRITTGPDTFVDTLRIDGDGLCVTRQADTFEVAGRAPIHVVNAPQVFVTNAVCRVDPCDGAGATQGCTVNGVRNRPCEGTDANDVIVGTTGDDVILGGGGRDQLRGGSGNDTLCGGEGDDRLAGALGNDILSGGPGEDRVKGSGGDDVLLGGDDADDLAGGGGLDELDGGPGDDRLRGGGDPDLLLGDVGTDKLDGGDDTDQCVDADQLGPFQRCELP